MRARATQRAFHQIGLLQTQRPEDAFAERVAQPHSRCRLDEEPEHEVVAAAIRPPLAGGKQPRLLQNQPKLVARPSSQRWAGSRRYGSKNDTMSTAKSSRPLV